MGRTRRKKSDQARPEPPKTAASAIRVRGARVHNLKNLDVDLPRDCLVVLTGVSGSGKSSLAFDTIHAEGQRRYLESVSSYAHQFLDQLERPDVDFIDGLAATVAIRQWAGAGNPRSTLGTVTEIYDYLRILFARLGAPYCPNCGVPIHRQSPEQMVSHLMRLPEGQKVQILAPLVRGKKGQHAEVFQAIRRAGLIRARVDGELIEVGDQGHKLAKGKLHSIDAVVDRISIREGIRPRLAESLDLALKLSGGGVVTLAQTADGWDEQYKSIHLNCPNCGEGLPAIEPRTFSFNSPYGACPACQGLGSRRAFRAELVVPDRSRSWDDGAVVPWPVIAAELKNGASVASSVDDFLTSHQLDATAPLGAWPDAAWNAFWEGERKSGFPGITKILDDVLHNARDERTRKALDVYREEIPCDQCGGSRLRPEARAVRLLNYSIVDLTAMPVGALPGVLDTLRAEPSFAEIGAQAFSEIGARIGYLIEVGLEYLTLGRASDSLSGGEFQRARLAAQLGSGLMGVCTILDEPTAGLHPRDTERLIASVRGLLARGNSVIVVEHDAAMIRAADWVVDLGPGPGPDGGTVVAAGTVASLRNEPASISARYLDRGFHIETGPSARLQATPGWIEIQGASLHNLKGVDARFPVAALTCVTGVSGSGKSTLINDFLVREVRRYLNRRRDPAVRAHGVSGLEAIEQLVEVDQSPIGRGPRSTPGTVTGVFDEIRRVFALTRLAKLRGYRASRFSFNAKAGRCEVCRGLGERRLPTRLLPDLHVRCEACGGKRFNHQTLEVRFKGLSIGDVLDSRVDQSRVVFDAVPRVLRGLNALHDVGLGYLTLGQSSRTLSGGEAQRVKLAAELGRQVAGRALYVLDEPTTGLHFADVERLLAILHRLADLGHTIIVIEHQLDVIAAADWVIDLGPGAGDRGGQVVAMGTPFAIATAAGSFTGEALRAGLPQDP